MAGELKITSAEQVEQGLAAAMAHCEAKNIKLTWGRLAVCCGVDCDTLNRYMREEVKTVEENEKSRIAVALKRAKAECEAETQENMHEHGNNGGTIFYAKNVFGYTDKQEISGTVGVTFTGEDSIPD